MQEIIEKLLILQDRDRKIMRSKDQLARIEPERRTLQERAAAAQAGMEAAKTKAKQVESDRKELELEVDSKKGLIERYALQQFETKKNEEYRALAQQIETCKSDITQLEDQQLALMEQAESLQKEAAAAARQAEEARKAAEQQLKDLTASEQALRAALRELESNREQLTEAIDDRVLHLYERLLRHKGDNVVVGIQHGVCGGCHMKFPVQLVVSCQAAKDLVACPNCGRILYYTPDMDLAVAD
ncbi:MAG: zinc ribbon domain-containing protein [Limisphaerales bacterium]